jgi:2'-5' RNA ligase
VSEARPEREERARLFVALELPADVRSALVEWRPSVPGLRALPIDSLHVTLCFLGWLPVAAVAAIADVCASVCAGAAEGLALGSPLWLPRRRPRVLAVSIVDGSGALASLQGALSAALAAEGWYAPENRRYLPHVTVARTSAGARLGSVPLAPEPEMTFTGSVVTVYRSRLSPGGAAYEPLSRVSLIGSPS